MAFINRNKRSGQDSITKSRNFIIMISVVLFCIVFFFLSIAQPRYENMFDRIYNTNFYQATWNKEVVAWAFYIMIPLAIISTIGLIFNSWRHNRKGDKYSKFLIFVLLFSIVGIIIIFQFLF